MESSGYCNGGWGNEEQRGGPYFQGYEPFSSYGSSDSSPPIGWSTSTFSGGGQYGGNGVLPGMELTNLNYFGGNPWTGTSSATTATQLSFNYGTQPSTMMTSYTNTGYIGGNYETCQRTNPSNIGWSSSLTENPSNCTFNSTIPRYPPAPGMPYNFNQSSVNMNYNGNFGIPGSGFETQSEISCVHCTLLNPSHFVTCRTCFRTIRY